MFIVSIFYSIMMDVRFSGKSKNVFNKIFYKKRVH